MIRLFVVLSVSLLAMPALAAELPAAFYTRKVTVELKQAEVRNVYRLIGDLMATEMRIDACLQKRKLDIKLKNAPVSVVLDVMASKLDVVHTTQPGGTAILVTCKGTAPTTAEPLVPQPGISDVARAPAEVLDRRLSLDVKDASLQRVAALLADAAGVKLRPMTELEGKVTLSVHNVRLETVMAIVRESLDLEVLDIVAGELVIAVVPPSDDTTDR